MQAAPKPTGALPRMFALASLAGRRLFAANAALLLLLGPLPLLGLWAMQQVLDAVAQGIGAADPAAAWHRVARAIAVAAAIAAFGALLRAIAAQVAETHARRTADAVSKRLLGRAGSLDLQQLETPAHADLLHRATQESGRAVRTVQDGAALLLAVVTILCLGGALATVQPWLPAAVGIAAVPQALLRLRHGRNLLAFQTASAAEQREVGYLAALIGGRTAAKDLRLFGATGRLMTEVAARRDALTGAQLQLSYRRLRGEAATEVLASVALFAVYLYLGYCTLQGELTIGGLFLQAQAVQRTQHGIRDGLLAASALREHHWFLDQLFTLLALEPTIRAPAVPRPVPVAPRETLACSDVAFTYPGSDRRLLDGVDLVLGRGERVALTGSNGAGKSTLVRLLCRLCDPDRGAVRFGGTDVREFDPEQFRRRLSVFFQDAAGLERSVRENLVLAGAAVPDSALWRVLDQLGLGPRVRALPQGLATRLGRSFEHGVQLSQGEWRRLLLARALLRDADVLILDEPFAFLDAAGQALLREALSTLPADRTVLLIEHRPDALALVDRILRLEDGRIARQQQP